MHHDQAVSIFHRIPQIVGNHDRCQVLFLYDLICQLHDQLRRLRIESGCMFIQDQEFDGRHGRHQKRHCLALSSGKSAHFYIQLILKPQIQLLKLLPVKLDPGLVGSSSQAVDLSFIVRQRHIFQDRHCRTGSHSRILIYPADPCISLEFFLLRNVLSSHQDLP